VILAYDRPQLLREALSSVAAQTFPPDEVVVIDDCSSVPLAIDPQITKSLDVRLIRNTSNLGPARSAVRGLEAIQSDLVAFLNDDDLWEPTFLERLVAALVAHPEASVAFSDHSVVLADGTPDSRLAAQTSRRFKRDRLRNGLIPNLPYTALVSRAMPGASFSLTRRGELNPAVISAGGDIWDYFLCLSACMSGRPGVYVADRLGSYRVSTTGLTATYWSNLDRRIAGLGRRIVAARIALATETLRVIAKRQRLVLAVTLVRALGLVVRRADPIAMWAGLDLIWRSLREPLPSG
jgi:glycosyltransferase involved in cell wall biosynthesis